MLQRAQAALKQHYTNTHCRKAEMSTYATESSAVPKQLHASTYCSRAEISTMWQRALLSQSSAIQIFTTNAAATKRHYENIQ